MSNGILGPARETPLTPIGYQSTLDAQIRMAAFKHVQKICQTQHYLEWADIDKGFIFNGERILLSSRALGIFKPKQMEHVLSIKTVLPRGNRKVWYQDQELVHREILHSEESVDYSFMGKNPNKINNQWLKEVYHKQIPIIYFIGVAPAKYQAVLPTYVINWNSETLSARICFGLYNETHLFEPQINSQPLQKYAMRQTKQRLHQAKFRAAVMEAYDYRCTFSGLPAGELLDAAHIVPYGEFVSKPIVTNGLALSKLHHEAFDRHLIGLDRNYKIHVSKHLLNKQDGPQLEVLKNLHERRIILPKHKLDRPDQELLDSRFEKFQEKQSQMDELTIFR